MILFATVVTPAVCSAAIVAEKFGPEGAYPSGPSESDECKASWNDARPGFFPAPRAAVQTGERFFIVS